MKTSLTLYSSLILPFVSVNPILFYEIFMSSLWYPLFGFTLTRHWIGTPFKIWSNDSGPPTKIPPTPIVPSNPKPGLRLAAMP